MGSMSGHWSEKAVDAIQHKCVNHEFYRQAVSRAFNAIDVCCPGEVVSLVGPSRVGKSRAVGDVRNLLVGPQDRVKSGQMPFVTITAGNESVRGEFSTRSLVVDGLTTMEHPVYGISHSDDPWGEKRDRLVARATEANLRSAFKTALKMRGTKFLVIDEAHHVQYAPGRIGTETAILDSWKCLAHDAGLILVLVGAYRLRDMLREAPHLLGRSRPIEFRRYNASRRAEADTFHRILKTLSEHICFYPSESLCVWHDLMMEGSLGCIGHVSRWVREALSLTRNEKSPVLTQGHLRETMASRSDLARLAEEILQGERSDAAEAHEGLHDGPPRAGDNVGRLRKLRPFQARPRRHRRNGRA